MGGEEVPDSTALPHLCTRCLVIPGLQSNHELRVGPYCPHRAVPSALTHVFPIPEGLQEHPTPGHRVSVKWQQPLRSFQEKNQEEEVSGASVAG